MLPAISTLFVEDSGVEKNKILEALGKFFDIGIHGVARTSDEFHELLTGRHWDLVICEAYLEHLNALEILDILNASGRNTPIFIFSAFADVKGAVDCIKHGATDYRTKDDLSGLINSIRSTLSRKAPVQTDESFEKEVLIDIIEESNELVFLIDQKTLHFRYVNRAAIEKTGFSFSEFQHKTPADIMKNFNFEQIKEKLMPLLDGDQEKVILFAELEGKNGKLFQSEATVQTIYRKNECLYYARVEDLSEKIRNYDHVLRMMQVLEYSNSGVFVVEKNGTVTYANPKFLRQTGFSEKDILYKNIDVVKNVVEASGEFDKIWSTVFSGRRWVGRTKSLRKGGGFVEVISSVSPIRNSKGEVSDLVFFEDDATLANEMKLQLIHAQKMETLGELAGGIAHDFNNVLTAVGGFASVISRKLIDRQDVKYFADKLLELAESGRSLTQGLLSYSRKREKDVKIVELDRAVHKVTDIISLVFPEDIVISMEEGSGIARIRISESELEQILMNLANNAKDAMPDGGLLSISTERDEEGKQAVVRVSDTGSGISEETMEKIFKPFFTTKEDGKGTGLGLAIVKEIVESHGGHISCKSVIGEGTVFTLYFPLVEMDELSCAGATADSLVKLSGSILIVDDDPSVRESLETMLEEFGYSTVSVDGYPNFVESSAMFGEISMALIDFVLADSGSILIEEALIEKYGELPIIYITGYDTETLTARGFDTKKRKFLRKPLFAQSLLKAIAEAAENKI